MTVLADILQPNLSLVICGSAVGRRSAEAQRYYAGPGNRLWHTLFEVGLTPTELAPDNARELLRFGIGLTDLVKDQSGSDPSIRFDHKAAADLRARILEYCPAFVCFNGKRAASEFLSPAVVTYGLQREVVGVTAIFVAPSTSAAARRWWDIAIWRDLARRVRLGAAT